LNGWLRF